MSVECDQKNSREDDGEEVQKNQIVVVHDLREEAFLGLGRIGPVPT